MSVKVRLYPLFSMTSWKRRLQKIYNCLSFFKYNCTYFKNTFIRLHFMKYQHFVEVTVFCMHVTNFNIPT